MTKHSDPYPKAPFRPLALGPYQCQVQKRHDGSWLIRSTEPLGATNRRYTERLHYWANMAPGRTFLAQRGTDGSWQVLDYQEAWEQVQQLAGALLERGLNAQRPLVILSENSVEHALLALAAMHVGIPYAPISPAYSLLSKTADRVDHALKLLTPGLVFAQDGERYAKAISLIPNDVELVCVSNVPAHAHSARFAQLLSERITPAGVEAAHDAVNPDTIAKFLFTSGSTKLPKAVINTHGMLTSNQRMYLQCYPYLEEEPPVLVDWLPWHHTAGGNHSFGTVLYNGGSLYIDGGKPVPEHMSLTIRNLSDVAPTLYYTVPKGLDILVQAMQKNAAFRDLFFSRIRNIFPVGAAIAGPLRDAVDELAIASTGSRIPMTVSLGMTETAPFALSAHTLEWQPGNIGIPAPGLDIKLTPVAGKLEVRYRGPNITPGYWRQPELTQEAFDEEGFFCSGDGALFLNPEQPAAGLRFNGRIAEDFKLDSGTWINVGDLRMRAITHGAPYIHDVVITGQDKPYLGMLVFLQRTKQDEISDVPKWIRQLLKEMARAATGSSQLIKCAMVMAEPPSLDLGEITDKGSINQQRVLSTRKNLVERLYASGNDVDVIRLE